MFLSKEKIKAIGFKKVGENVLISEKASIYNAKNISIENNVRIDDFCIMSAGEGGIELHSFIHISCYSALIGSGKITIESHCNVSPRSIILSSNDDYTGLFMVGSMEPLEYRKVNNSPIHMKPYSTIGAGSVVLPGVTIGYNSSIGALSLVSKNIKDNELHGGVPCKKIRDKDKSIFI